MDALTFFAGRKVFVTGATGTLGREFFAVARRAGANVRAPGRADGFDLRDPVAASAAIRNFQPELIYHFAAAGVSQPIDEAGLAAINVGGLDVLLAAAAEQPSPPKCLLLGTCAEYAASDALLAEDSSLGPRNAYARSKVAAAKLAQEYATRLPILWLRMFNVYGAGEKLPRLLPYLVDCARRGLPAEVTAGDQLLDYTAAADAADIFLKLGLAMPAAPGWSACNVGTGREVAARRFMETACDVLRLHGLPLELRLGAKAYRNEDPMRCLPDITRLRSYVGEPPLRPLETGLADAVQQMLA